jgi:hypothetical protein
MLQFFQRLIQKAREQVRYHACGYNQACQDAKPEGSRIPRIPRQAKRNRRVQWRIGAIREQTSRSRDQGENRLL